MGWRLSLLQGHIGLPPSRRSFSAVRWTIFHTTYLEFIPNNLLRFEFTAPIQYCAESDAAEISVRAETLFLEVFGLSVGARASSSKFRFTDQLLPSMIHLSSYGEMREIHI
jgi:hypothetical protein